MLGFRELYRNSVFTRNVKELNIYNQESMSNTSPLSPTEKTTKAEKLDNAYWLDESLALDTTNHAFENFCKEILEDIYKANKTQRKNINKHLPQLKILILNLIVALEFHGGVIAISKAKETYSPLTKLSYRVMVELLVNSLVSMDYLKQHRGFFGGLVGRRSKFEFLKPFEDKLFQSGIEDTAISHTKPDQLVILKDEHKRPIKVAVKDLKVEEEINLQVAQINNRIQSSFVDLILTNEELGEVRHTLRTRKDEMFSKHNKPRRLDFTNSHIHRTFNNSSFEQGGRFYGGWWETIPKEFRPYITTDNWFTEELDYSGMHINLLYNQLGIDIRELFEDPYLIPGLDPCFREVTKIIMLILLNAATPIKALKAINIKAKEKDSKIILPDSIKDFKDYIELINQYHAPIRQFFGSGEGIKLQGKDAQIANAVMLRMDKEHQATCLPIHDSFIVADPHVKHLRKIMHEEYKALSGFECRVDMKSATLGKVDTEERLKLIEAMYENDDEELWGYRSRYATWMKKNNWRYETEGGEPINEKPGRL